MKIKMHGNYSWRRKSTSMLMKSARNTRAVSLLTSQAFAVISSSARKNTSKQLLIIKIAPNPSKKSF
jgi:hypothetical protein